MQIVPRQAYAQELRRVPALSASRRFTANWEAALPSLYAWRRTKSLMPWLWIDARWKRDREMHSVFE